MKHGINGLDSVWESVVVVMRCYKGNGAAVAGGMPVVCGRLFQFVTERT